MTSTATDIEALQQAGVVRLACATQKYEWGRSASSSKVAEYARSTPGTVIDQSSPYAELWMGTHPNAPSVVADPVTGERTSVSLSALIAKDPQRLLGSEIASKFGGDLPFLFKVLSIGKALSIQAHPDKKLAEKLHSQSPHLYKDPNHKPEMALAITPFEGMCGFRPLAEIAQHLNEYPELRSVVGDSVSKQLEAVANNSQATKDEIQNALRNVFGAMMTHEASKVSELVNALVERVSDDGLGTTNGLVHKLNREFPGDVGVFSALLLNYVQLQPGQAIYLAANEPHAYISGDCVECMATSDNVVRAGLTPKFKDVEVLVNMLTYTPYNTNDVILSGDPYNSTSPSSTIYDPPIDEFSVVRTALEAGDSEHFEPVNGPSILLVTDGVGYINAPGITEYRLVKGTVYFVAANTPVDIRASASGSGLLTFRAFCAI
ncbi:phosphomannose isomerase type I [Ramicandelaber brevisporus]|nr:phosphomannose isomerase type I [Ramicandelaber brevisporus]